MMIRSYALATIAVCLVALGPGVLADEPAIDNIENVPTPTTLAELLPEGGIDAVDVDYWLTMTMKTKAGQVGNECYYHWSIKPEGDTLVFEFRYGYNGANARHTHRRTAYSAKGDVVGYREVTRFSNGETRTKTGEVVGDEWVVKTTVSAIDGEVHASDVSRSPAEREQGTVPAEWLPLILAYHIRNASLGYRYKTTNPVGQPFPEVNRAVDLGVEAVQVDGEDRRAHLLAIVREYEPNDHTTRIKMLVTEAGEVLSMDSEADPYRMAYRRTTAEEVAERFGLELEQ